MTFGSLFAGIGGFDLGLERAGLCGIWQVENDQHCLEVLTARWPQVDRWPDILNMNPADFECPDVICFGSPCQDLSVAGKHAGLDGERSGLFHEAVRVIRAFVSRGLRFALWENVPGAFSSRGGRDFAAVLRALAQCGAVDIAWRVLDCRWLSLAQRRQRVFLVADFRAERAAEILSLAESLSGHPAPRRQARQEVAGTISGSSPSRRGAGSCPGHLIAGTIQAGQLVATLAPGGHPGGITGREAELGSLVVTHALRTQERLVRRLTPLEYERLMGFPEDWTKIKTQKGKPMSDSARYRMLGNAVCPPVAEYIGKRLLVAFVKQAEKTAQGS